MATCAFKLERELDGGSRIVRCVMCGNTIRTKHAPERVHAACLGPDPPIPFLAPAVRSICRACPQYRNPTPMQEYCQCDTTFKEDGGECIKPALGKYPLYLSGKARCPRYSVVKDLSVFVLGYPGTLGGANTELWHTLKLWRQYGLRVTLIPTWGEPEPEQRARVEAIGCKTVAGHPDLLQGIEGLAGATVVSFCNEHFLKSADKLRAMGCKLVWVNCMNWLHPSERLFCNESGAFDAYVFQSQFQHDELAPQLKQFRGDRQCHVIHGAFDPGEFPLDPTPHKQGEPFVVGRLSRAYSDKYNRKMWEVYGRIPHNTKARVMGWDQKIQDYCGKPPAWAEVLPANAEPAPKFLRSLHALVPVAGGAIENWPRVGLEAMACGVPLVVDASGGWPEMVEHGQTGYLCKSHDEIAYYAARLAYDEQERMGLIIQARQAVERLSEPGTLWEGWQKVFEALR